MGRGRFDYLCKFFTMSCLFKIRLIISKQIEIGIGSRKGETKALHILGVLHYIKIVMVSLNIAEAVSFIKSLKG